MKQKSLTQFMTSVVEELKTEGRFGTAHVYAATLNALTAFVGGGEIYFGALNPRMLKLFENHLRNRQCKWNTVSTYLRTLRATYNRAVDCLLVPLVPRLFKGVFTGVKNQRKLALTAAEVHRLLYAPPRQPLTEQVARSRAYLQLMFQLQGMPFVDLAHLHQSDYDRQKQLLTCHRQKTGTPLVVNISRDTARLLEQFCVPKDEQSPFLLNILGGETRGEEAYGEYQGKLRRLNSDLKILARIQGVEGSISSYTARHTWATLAKLCSIPEGLIGDALGHTSVKTTETYLKSFDNSSLRKANNKVIACAQKAVTL